MLTVKTLPSLMVQEVAASRGLSVAEFVVWFYPKLHERLKCQNFNLSMFNCTCEKHFICGAVTDQLLRQELNAAYLSTTDVLLLFPKSQCH
jgi:hypothetical protein